MSIDLAQDPSLGHPATLSTTRVGLLGCGTVGSEVASELLGRGDAWGLPLSAVAVAHPDKRRTVVLDAARLKRTAEDVVTDESIDVVVELIGGLELPLRLIKKALLAGKSVVTANKEVIAEHGDELVALAAARGVGLYFEGAVAGAIPIVKVLSGCLNGDRIKSITGILNGTSNFVLDAITCKGLSFDAALDLARSSGYAEEDATQDLSGNDAARKAAILAWLAFGSRLDPSDVFVRGIDWLSVEDIHSARRLGYITKSVVRIAKTSGFVRATVEPELVPATSPLANVSGAGNKIIVETELAGTLTLEGPGAGGKATASAVIADIMRAARGEGSPLPRVIEEPSQVLSSLESPGRYLVRAEVVAGSAEGRLTGSLFTHGIGIDRLESRGGTEVVAITDFTDRKCIEKALSPLGSDVLEDLSITKVGESILPPI